MSSREISTMVNSRHADLMRSIDRLSKKGIIQTYTPLAYTNERNNQIHYEYLISKRDTYVIVAQNSPEFTAALVDRWQDLEKPYLKTDLLPDHSSDIKIKQRELEILIKKQELSDAYNALSSIEDQQIIGNSSEIIEDAFAKNYLSRSKNKKLHSVARNIIRLTSNPFIAYKGRGEPLNKALDALKRVSLK